MRIDNKYEALLDSLTEIEQQTAKLIDINNKSHQLQNILEENKLLQAQLDYYQNQLQETNKVLKNTLKKLMELEKNH